MRLKTLEVWDFKKLLRTRGRQMAEREMKLWLKQWMKDLALLLSRSRGLQPRNHVFNCQWLESKINCDECSDESLNAVDPREKRFSTPNHLLQLSMAVGQTKLWALQWMQDPSRLLLRSRGLQQLNNVLNFFYGRRGNKIVSHPVDERFNAVADMLDAAINTRD